jgi:hypothetical protein
LSERFDQRYRRSTRPPFERWGQHVRLRVRPRRLRRVHHRPHRRRQATSCSLLQFVLRSLACAAGHAPTVEKLEPERGRCIMVMPLPSKQESRVRFPPPAPNLEGPLRRTFYSFPGFWRFLTGGLRGSAGLAANIWPFRVFYVTCLPDSLPTSSSHEDRPQARGDLRLGGGDHVPVALE